MLRILILLLFITTISFSQEKENIENYTGIWIAQDYYTSFERTNSCLASRDAFDPNAPVGLRINTSEINNGKLTIGFSSLHDHFIRPEVSEYRINQKDTIREQGSFEIKLSEQNNVSQFQTSEISFFNENWKSYLVLEKDTVILYRPANKELKERRIKYIRVKNSFDVNYKYPNPLYFYTRNKLLAGNYTLKDSTNTIITTNMTSHTSGEIKGFTAFEGKKIYYSTDIYCGPPVIDELVLVCDKIQSYNTECNGFVFKRIDQNTIHLYDTHRRNEFNYKSKKLGKATYQLIKNNKL